MWLSLLQQRHVCIIRAHSKKKKKKKQMYETDKAAFLRLLFFFFPASGGILPLRIARAPSIAKGKKSQFFFFKSRGHVKSCNETSRFASQEEDVHFSGFRDGFFFSEPHYSSSSFLFWPLFLTVTSGAGNRSVHNAVFSTHLPHVKLLAFASLFVYIYIFLRRIEPCRFFAF